MILNMMGGGGSGGAELNFEVVGGTTQPTNPKENCIWVNTENTITGWSFNATEPIASEGLVWFDVSTSSSAKFNALCVNAIQVYPISAKQYISGAWVDVTAMSYQGDEWVDWKTYLFNDGKVVQWTAYGSGCKISNDAIVFNSTVDYRGAYTSNKIDLANYSKIIAVGEVSSVWNTDSYNIPRFIVTRTPVTNSPNNGDAHLHFTQTGHVKLELDISGIQNGSYYVEIWGAFVGSFTQIYLEQ